MNGIVFALTVLATSIVLVAALAWVSRRLLGLPVGALRATESGHLAAFFSVALGVPLIVAMIFIVAAEALVPGQLLSTRRDLLPEEFTRRGRPGGWRRAATR